MARPLRRFSDALIQRLRDLSPKQIFILLDCFVTDDPTFVPTKDKSTKLYRVTTADYQKHYDFLVTGNLWFDKSASDEQPRKGGRDGISLAMYLTGNEFVSTVKLLQKALAEHSSEINSSRRTTVSVNHEFQSLDEIIV